MTNHRSTLLTEKDVNEAFVIIPVKRELGYRINTMFPGVQSKLRYFPEDVQDPWHAPLEVYRQCSRQVSMMIESVYKDIIIP